MMINFASHLTRGDSMFSPCGSVHRRRNKMSMSVSDRDDSCTADDSTNNDDDDDISVFSQFSIRKRLAKHRMEQQQIREQKKEQQKKEQLQQTSQHSSSLPTPPQSPTKQSHALSPRKLLRRVSMPRGEFAAALEPTPAPTPLWDETSRKESLEIIRQVMQLQYEKQTELDTLIDHSNQFIVARIESGNDIGSMISMKQALKYECQRLQSVRALKALQEVWNDVSNATMLIDFDSRVQAILDKPAPKHKLLKKSVDKSLLLEATRRRAVNLNQQSQIPL